MKDNKASGPNSIPIRLLKIRNYHISVSLSILINYSFESGIFPDKLKITQIIPIFKKDDSSLVSNYRPISLLSILSKVFEKAMYERLYKLFEKYEILYSMQFGFRTNHSTDHALVSMTEKLKSPLDSNSFGCGIFVDLEKAFDTVNHSILLQKMEHYGERGVVHQWFASYLSYQEQFVSANRHNSSLKVLMNRKSILKI